MSTPLITYLHQLEDIHRRIGNSRSREWFVLKYGRHWDEHSTARVRPMKVGACYLNAYRMATMYPKKYTYVEGFAHAGILPVLHAWVVDNSGRVVDPTWHPDNGFNLEGGSDYYGIPIKMRYLFRHILKTGYAGMLDAPPWNFTQITAREFRPWIDRRFYRKDTNDNESMATEIRAGRSHPQA